MNDFLQNPSWCYLAWVYHGAFSIFFLTWLSKVSWGFPGGSRSKEPASQCRRHKWHGFDPWVGKIHESRKWQSTLVFLPGESQGQRSQGDYSPWGHKESDITEATEWYTIEAWNSLIWMQHIWNSYHSILSISSHLEMHLHFILIEDT